MASVNCVHIEGRICPDVRAGEEEWALGFMKGVGERESHRTRAATPPLPPAATASSSTSTPRPPTDITPKTVILDSALKGQLGLTIDVASLKVHGVDKTFWLELDDNSTEHDELDEPAPPPSSAPGLIIADLAANNHVDVDASLIPGRKREYGRSPRHTHFFFRRPKSRSPGGPREPNTATSTPSTSAKRKYLLSSNTDPLYTRLRDLNFFAVSERLHLMATRLNASRELRSFGPGPYIWQHGQQTRSGKRTSCGKQR
ncbi:unnamed protein product [Tilletia caries]|nr:unnamed protein product [Tilletia caries]